MKAYVHKKLFTLLMVLSTTGFFPATTFGSESLITAPAPLAQLIDEGIGNNQSIKQIEAQIKESEARESVAGSLQDPRLGIGALNLPVDSFRFDQEPMTQKQISVAQKFPWFGKLGLRKKNVTLSTKQKKMMLTSKKLALSKKIALAWYDLGFIDQDVNINRRLIEMVDRLQRSAESRYATGYGLQQDIFQAQVERSRLEDEKITLVKNRRVLEDRIHELLNRASYTAIASVPEPAPLSLNLSVADLISAAKTHNPDLAVRRIEIARGRTQVDLAKKDFLPDFDVKLAYGQRDDGSNGQSRDDFVSAGVTMNLPLWYHSRQNRNLAATEASRLAAEHDYQDLRNRLDHRIDALVTEIQELQHNQQLYETTLLPQAEQWTRSADDAYAVNKMEFDAMINAHIRLLKFSLQAKRYLFDIYKKQAELEALTGLPLAAIHPEKQTTN